ncbi:prolipoprotein diacylglyceryl transferase [Siculibacillus lacustris]|uniref:Phosphatidylglycerol--prolipoprotein diacylglyceryl transferase n=1 Tax=Siculibacillus lacustris TaxID=1549641 RepID=A0A4Q9VHU5_9HYPH|nr:prolipoprotein diacylglyceryl transferase [Siculibacillus lacustris]TBW34741.1 prolipoprotein diacylglyceryl transferase [Siculibacillus lacustris]
MPLYVLPFPAFDPIAVQLGPLAIRWYALAYIAGILIGWWWVRRLIADDRPWGGRPRPNAPEIDDFVLWATLGIVLGGRIGYVLFYNPAHYLANPSEIVMVWKGGMAFHGGFLGSVAAMVLFARGRSFSFLTLFDLFAAAAPIGLFFGRLANFVNGELWGRTSDVAWAMVFPYAGPVARHPSQLYEAALEGVLLFAVLAVIVARTDVLRRPGLLAGLFATGYGLARIAAEFFREPDAQLGFLAGGVTMGQVLSLPMVAAGLALAIWAARRVPRSDPP